MIKGDFVGRIIQLNEAINGDDSKSPLSPNFKPYESSSESKKRGEEMRKILDFSPGRTLKGDYFDIDKVSFMMYQATEKKVYDELKSKYNELKKRILKKGKVSPSKYKEFIGFIADEINSSKSKDLAKEASKLNARKDSVELGKIKDALVAMYKG